MRSTSAKRISQGYRIMEFKEPAFVNIKKYYTME